MSYFPPFHPFRLLQIWQWACSWDSALGQSGRVCKASQIHPRSQSQPLAGLQANRILSTSRLRLIPMKLQSSSCCLLGAKQLNRSNTDLSFSWNGLTGFKIFDTDESRGARRVLPPWNMAVCPRFVGVKEMWGTPSTVSYTFRAGWPRDPLFEMNSIGAGAWESFLPTESRD